MEWLDREIEVWGLDVVEAALGMLVELVPLGTIAERVGLPEGAVARLHKQMGTQVDLYFVHQDMWNLAMGEEVVEELDPNVMDPQEMKGCLLDLEVEVGHARRRLHYATTHEPRLFTQDGMGNLHTSLHRALETTTAALDAIKEAQASSRE